MSYCVQYGCYAWLFSQYLIPATPAKPLKCYHCDFGESTEFCEQNAIPGECQEGEVKPLSLQITCANYLI